MDHLPLEYIQLPSTDQQQQYINSFQTKWDAQQCIGTIDRSHMWPGLTKPDLYPFQFFDFEGLQLSF